MIKNWGEINTTIIVNVLTLILEIYSTLSTYMKFIIFMICFPIKIDYSMTENGQEVS